MTTRAWPKSCCETCNLKCESAKLIAKLIQFSAHLHQNRTPPSHGTEVHDRPTQMPTCKDHLGTYLDVQIWIIVNSQLGLKLGLKNNHDILYYYFVCIMYKMAWRIKYTFNVYEITRTMSKMIFDEALVSLEGTSQQQWMDTSLSLPFWNQILIFLLESLN